MNSTPLIANHILEFYASVSHKQKLNKKQMQKLSASAYYLLQYDITKRITTRSRQKVFNDVTLYLRSEFTVEYPKAQNLNQFVTSRWTFTKT